MNDLESQSREGDANGTHAPILNWSGHLGLAGIHAPSVTEHANQVLDASLEAVLDCVRFATERLRRGSEWEASLIDVLERVGHATCANRAGLFRCQTESDARATVLQAEWVAPACAAPVLDASLAGLASGTDFEAARGSTSESLVAPVLVGGVWWGFLCLDPAPGRRAWRTAELDALRAIAGALGVAIECQRQAERQILSERALSLGRAQQEASLDGILVMDETRKVVSVNQRFYTLWELPDSLTASDREDALLDRAMHSAEEPYAFLRLVMHLHEHPEQTGRHEVRLLSGGVLDCYSAPIVGTHGEHYGRVWFFRDVTEARRSEAELRRLATTDSLTGVHTRRHFLELAERERRHALRYGRPLSLLIIDIDHFKRVNDTFGHAGGDAALVQASRACTEPLRSGDILGRIGGEEFGVLLRETDANSSELIAERIRAAVARTELRIGSRLARITVSIGVANMTSAAEPIATLLQRADVALYSAKKAGRNRVVPVSNLRRARAEAAI